MIQKYILSFFCIFLLSVLAYIPINSTSQPRGISQIQEDLTGIWRGQDQSTYYVRHFPNTYYDCPPYEFFCGNLKSLGRNIMWVGLSPDNGKSWANVFVGEYKVHGKITGTWVDVPRGGVRGSGTLTLQLHTTADYGAQQQFEYGYLIMSKEGSTGSPFGTSSWYKPSCPIPEYNLDWDRRSTHYLLPEKACGWDKNLPADKLEQLLPEPELPALHPPPEFGKK